MAKPVSVKTSSDRRAVAERSSANTAAWLVAGRTALIRPEDDDFEAHAGR